MINLRQTHSFIRFLLVGMINTFVGLSIMFILLNLFGWSYWSSTCTGISIGAVISYILNRSYTFNSKVSNLTGVLRFTAVILGCYLLSYSISFLVTLQLVIPEGLVKIITVDHLSVLLGTALYTLSNYFGQRFFVFTN
ncbi:GtrA family protein [Oceanobacillus salinisoli]|uniref:GtrA family protein n=1 Tax=Oceanobacillus salinisoli TaxID=2678611 RepID=UPI001E51CDFE|nr:GtrA family protein [Oceanobacillus salinisoli]